MLRVSNREKIFGNLLLCVAFVSENLFFWKMSETVVADSRSARSKFGSDDETEDPLSKD